MCLERRNGTASQVFEAREWEVTGTASSFIPAIRQDPNSKGQLFCKFCSPGDHRQAKLRSHAIRETAALPLEKQY